MTDDPQPSRAEDQQHPLRIRGLTFHPCGVDQDAEQWATLLPSGTRLELAKLHVSWEPERWRCEAIGAQGTPIARCGVGVSGRGAYDDLQAAARRAGDLRTLEALALHVTGAGAR